MKKKRGRPKDSGKPSISRQQTTEARALLLHGRHWQMIRLRQSIGDGSKLPDNFLTAALAQYDAKAAAHVRECKAIFRKYPASAADERLRRLRKMRHKLPLMPLFLSVWRTLLTRFERAVLDGDAAWFRSQADAIDEGDKRTDADKDRDRFRAEVLARVSFSKDKHPARKVLDSFVQRIDTKPLTDKEKRTILELEPYYNHAVIEDMIGKSYTRNKDDELIAVSKGGGALVVEWTFGKRTYSCRFKNKRCALDTIRDISRQIQEAHRFS